MGGQPLSFETVINRYSNIQRDQKMSEYSNALIYSSVSGTSPITVSINDDIFTGSYAAANVPASLAGNAVICDIKTSAHSALNAPGNYGVKDAWFTGNVCDSAGGALRNDGASLTISGSTFQNGTSGSYGGAIYNSGQPVTISGTEFTGNSAKYGGALHFGGNNVLISNSKFSSNYASEHGGAVSLYNAADITVSNSRFDYNYGKAGGVFYTQNTVKLSISGSTFTGNTSGISGGVIYAGSTGTLSISDSLFNQNLSMGEAGIGDGGSVINITAGNALISGSTFTGNTSSVARGAIYVHGTAAVTIENTQFNDNSCPTDKGWQAASIFVRGQVSLNNVVFNDACISIFATSAATLTVKGLVTIANSDSRIWVQTGGKFIIDGDALTGENKVARALDVTSSNWQVNGDAAPAASENYQLFTHHNDVYIAESNTVVNTSVVLVSDTIAANGDGAEFTIDGNDYVGVGYRDLASAMALENKFLVENYTHTYGSISLKCDEKIQFGENVRFDRNLLTAQGQGGAMIVTGGTLKNVAFSGNTAYNGGAVYSHVAPVIDSVTFTGNSATNGGGALMLETNGGTLSSVTFTGNSANNYGGALYTYGGKLDISSSTFRNNSANTFGGAIFASGSASVKISDTLFEANRTKAALHINSSASGNIIRSKFSGNLNGAMEITGSAEISGSTFSGNSALNGGAIIFDGGTKTLTITDSEFSGNISTNPAVGADSGSAIHVLSGTVNISDTVFSGNSAASAKGAVFVGAGSSVVIRNSEFSGNTFGSAGYAASIFVRGKLELANVSFDESAQAMYFSGSSGAEVTVTGLITLKNSKSTINIGGAVFQIAGGSFVSENIAVNKAIETEFSGTFCQNGEITVDDSEKYTIFTASNDLYVTGKNFAGFAAIVSTDGDVYNFNGYAGPGYTSFAAVDKTISVDGNQVALNTARQTSREYR